MSKSQIRAWQKLIGVTADGDFGNDTKEATIAFAERTGLIPKPIEPPPIIPPSDSVDARSEATIATLLPQAQEYFRSLLKAINAAIAPKVWKWTSGTRSYAEQKKLHDAYLNGGPKAAPPGYSTHQFGISCDGTVFQSDTRTPQWEGSEYDVAGKLGRQMGFHWGADFGDKPHFCKRPPSLEDRTEAELLNQLRYRHETGIATWP